MPRDKFAPVLIQAVEDAFEKEKLGTIKEQVHAEHATNCALRVAWPVVLHILKEEGLF